MARPIKRHRSSMIKRKIAIDKRIDEIRNELSRLQQEQYDLYFKKEATI